MSFQFIRGTMSAVFNASVFSMRQDSLLLPDDPLRQTLLARSTPGPRPA